MARSFPSGHHSLPRAGSHPIGVEFKNMRRILWRVLVATTIVLIGSIGGIYYFVTASTVKPVPDGISWRANIFVKKAYGGIPELSWMELWKMIAHEGGFSLGMVSAGGLSLDAALVNPFTRHEDLKVGGQLFRERCARCHGPDGEGYRAVTGPIGI